MWCGNCCREAWSWGCCMLPPTRRPGMVNGAISTAEVPSTSLTASKQSLTQSMRHCLKLIRLQISSEHLFRYFAAAGRHLVLCRAVLATLQLLRCMSWGQKPSFIQHTYNLCHDCSCQLSLLAMWLLGMQTAVIIMQEPGMTARCKQMPRQWCICFQGFAICKIEATILHRHRHTSCSVNHHTSQHW